MRNIKVARWVSIVFISLVLIGALVTGILALVNPSQIYQESFPEDTSNNIQFHVAVSSVDVLNYFVKLHYKIDPQGTYALSVTDNPYKFSNIPRYDITSKLDNSISFSRKERNIGSQDATIPLSSGEYNRFPFDVYEFDFIVESQISDEFNNTVSAPVSLIILGFIQGWEFKVELFNLDTQIQAYFVFSRSISTKAFSIFIFIIMWLISLSIFGVASFFWEKDSAPELPLIIVSGSMLFAMPALRNTQPGVPAIGCSMDAFGFFWNMLLISTSLCLLIWKYLLKKWSVQEKERQNSV